MNTELTKLTPAVNDIELTAMVPAEMQESQKQLISWCELKLSAVRAEATELQEAYEHAQRQKWKVSVLKRHWDLAEKRVIYFEKIKAALEHGYYIVPNFPIQMFAIRTDRKSPLKIITNSRWENKEQFAQQLSEGTGEYKNPFPVIWERTVGSGENSKLETYARDWDEFEFPIMMAKPRIMEATTQAMALRIFDRIGIMPAAKKEDPVIIGQIFNKAGRNEKIVSFMIAWHLNTNVL